MTMSRVTPIFAAMSALFVVGCVPAPHLSVSTETLRFEPSDTPISKTFEITNEGDPDTTLTVAVTSSEPWLSVVLDQTTSKGPEDVITATVTLDPNFSNLKADPSFATGIISVVAGEESEDVVATTTPDYFTQQVDGNDASRLEGNALSFIPNGGPNFYEQVNSPINGFPTTPGGQEVDFSQFSDPVQAGLLDGKEVSFYDQRFDTIWISSQGWVSFGDAPGSNPNTLEQHFEVPRVSGLPVDAKTTDSIVTLQQDNQKVVVSYENAKTKGTTDSNNDFQLEFHFDGTIRLNYVNVDPVIKGIVGLSVGGFQGQTPEGFEQSDLAAANTAPLGAVQ